MERKHILGIDKHGKNIYRNSIVLIEKNSKDKSFDSGIIKEKNLDFLKKPDRTVELCELDTPYDETRFIKARLVNLQANLIGMNSKEYKVNWVIN